MVYKKNIHKNSKKTEICNYCAANEISTISIPLTVVKNGKRILTEEGIIIMQGMGSGGYTHTFNQNIQNV